MSGSQYARLVPKKYRSRTLPKIDRPWRPRVIAWAGPSAFYPNRFYEIDKWYKARIDKPEKLPEMFIIDPSEHTKSLNELLAKAENQPINIGFKKTEKIAKKVKNEEDQVELERKSRNLQLKINMDEIEFPNLDVCRHFSIFEDLFGKDIFFENVQGVDISFENNVVYNGNILTAETTTQKPNVLIESVGKEGFNTLLMINLDGNAFEKKGEIVQWLITNIEDGKGIENGEEIVNYLQPLPFYGTGYHRVAFLLFRHNQKIEFENLPLKSELQNRILNVAEFYKNYEDILTPSAIQFFQTSYDDSVKQTLHSIGLKSPLYEYEYLPPLKPEQREFPEKAQPFDLYLDMYRDPKEVESEILEKRLEKVGLENVEEPKWIDINYNENKKNLPGWLHAKMLEKDEKSKGIYENRVD